MATKAQLINSLARTEGITKRAAANAVDAVFSAIQDDLVASGAVVLPGVGKLRLGKRPGRAGRNPRTGEVITIGEKLVVKFRPSAAIKRAVNQ